MLQLKSLPRNPLARALRSLYAIEAHTSSFALILPSSVRQKEMTMTVAIWIVIGVWAGLIGRRLEKKSGDSKVPDVLLGVVGAVGGGWLFYTFGTPGVNGLHLATHYAAFITSSAFLLTYYAIRRL
jgi:uncharacterized membrane protein YeaQ/YmgE (transglycosylase-associated protein family)